MPRKNNDDDKNKKNDGRFDEMTMWRYWKRTVLEDLDELRNIIIDCRLEQARLEVEQMELELRIERLEKMMTMDYRIIEIDLEIDGGEESD